jgi:vacuolar-type H+-ATPase subunit H
MAVTTAAVVGIAATAATTGMSFAQAGKQRKLMREAEREADMAMQEARKKLEVNVFDQLSIQKEPYELEREALLSQGAQAIQQAVEGEGRGLAATAGRVQMAQQEGQAAVRSAMGQELQGLERLSAQEEGRLRDIGVQLDLEEVAGAQLAAANAQELQAQSMQQGFEGVTSLAGQLASFAPLYEKGAAGRQIGRLEGMGGRQLGLSETELQNRIAGLGTIGETDFGKVSGMNRSQYLDFMSKVDPNTLKNIRQQELGLYGFDPRVGSSYGKLGKQIGSGIKKAYKGL